MKRNPGDVWVKELGDASRVIDFFKIDASGIVCKEFQMNDTKFELVT